MGVGFEIVTRYPFPDTRELLLATRRPLPAARRKPERSGGWRVAGSGKRLPAEGR